MKFQIIHRLNHKVIFELDEVDNTMKKTVQEAAVEDVNMEFADLEGIDLRGVYFHGTNLRGANLQDANLRGANLQDANLQCADLRGANLSEADFQGAELYNANLEGANLRNANFQGATNVPFIPLACPSDGAFIGWKKVYNCLIKLLIPEDARRCSATTNKCRCDKAQVLEIVSLLEGKNLEEIMNNKQYSPLRYTVGEMVYPDSFDVDRWKECSHGIHFFINKQDAINY